MSIKNLVTNEAAITWQDLKDVSAKLSPEQLKMPVMFWGEGVFGKFKTLQELQEDYVNPSGDGCEPVSVYADEPEFLENEPVIYQKNTIIFELIQD